MQKNINKKKNVIKVAAVEDVAEDFIIICYFAHIGWWNGSVFISHRTHRIIPFCVFYLLLNYFLP